MRQRQIIEDVKSNGEQPMAGQSPPNTPTMPVGGKATLYEIIHEGDGWTIIHDGEKLGTLGTRMAAFDNVVSGVRSSIIEGYEITINLGREPSYPI